MTTSDRTRWTARGYGLAAIIAGVPTDNGRVPRWVTAITEAGAATDDTVAALRRAATDPSLQETAESLLGHPPAVLRAAFVALGVLPPPPDE